MQSQLGKIGYVSSAELNEIQDRDAIEVTGLSVKPLDGWCELFQFGDG